MLLELEEWSAQGRLHIGKRKENILEQAGQISQPGPLRINSPLQQRIELADGEWFGQPRAPRASLP